MLRFFMVGVVMATLVAITSSVYVQLQPLRVELSQLSLNEVGRPTYKNELFTGDAVTYYPSGQIASLEQYVGGHREGHRKKWHENGLPSLEMFYINGRAHGYARSWWRTGMLRSEFFYDNGKKDGVALTWYQSGALYKKSNYVSGKVSGLQQAWRENGDLTANFEYRNGRVFGLNKANTCIGLEDETLSIGYKAAQGS